MDSVSNPFSPSAGSRPPELVGRDDVLELARVLMGRTKLRRSVQSLLMTGLRGVGKTVLLNEMRRSAEADGAIVPIQVEASEHRRLVDLLAAPLKIELLKLNRIERSKVAARKALSVLRNFLGTVKISIGEVGVELEPCPGEGDSGDLQYDLRTLLATVAEAAAARNGAVVLLIDEVQYLNPEELESLVMALHYMLQRELPLAMVGAGLPILAKMAGDAKSYAERLFKYPVLGPLSDASARRAICVPFAGKGIRIKEEALTEICRETNGYPYFIQEWGSQLWNFVDKGPVGMREVNGIRSAVLDSLDANFYHIRMERVTSSERQLLRAMAEVALEDGSCRISDVVERMGVSQKAIGPRRGSLIKKGVVYGSGHGELSFTVPLFADFMKRNPEV